MEKLPHSLEREREIEVLIGALAEREGMAYDDIISDIVTFAPYEGNDTPNSDYLDQLAEMLGITPDEMTTFALKKAKDHLEQ